MLAKSAVLEHFPKARAKKYEWSWCIYDGNKLGPMGSGRTAAQAWQDAYSRMHKMPQT